VSVTPGQRTRILERDGFKCRRCGAGRDAILQVDHVDPKSKGGTDTDDNLQTLCRVCNLGKRDRPPHPHDLALPHSEAPAEPIAAPTGLVGWYAFGSPGHTPTSENLGWQTKIAAEINGRYLVQRFSWIDGEPTDAVLVAFDDMAGWLFFQTAEEWRRHASEINETYWRRQRKQWEQEEFSKRMKARAAQ